MTFSLGLSGGMDSATVLLEALATGESVICLNVDYGQAHKIETKAASSIVKYLQEKLVLGEVDKENLDQGITLLSLDLSALGAHLTGCLTENSPIPQGAYDKPSMAATVVPNRNKIFLSILQAIALSYKGKVAFGNHAGDHTIYPDCRPEFIEADDKAFKLGNWGADVVESFSPYGDFTKGQVLARGIELCELLGLDWSTYYGLTHTSYSTVTISGLEFSSYKSGSSVERIEAFEENNLVDPLQYADERGLQPWGVAVAYMKKVML